MAKYCIDIDIPVNNKLYSDYSNIGKLIASKIMYNSKLEYTDLYVCTICKFNSFFDIVNMQVKLFADCISAKELQNYIRKCIDKDYYEYTRSFVDVNCYVMELE